MKPAFLSNAAHSSLPLLFGGNGFKHLTPPYNTPQNEDQKYTAKGLQNLSRIFWVNMSFFTLHTILKLLYGKVGS